MKPGTIQLRGIRLTYVEVVNVGHVVRYDQPEGWRAAVGLWVLELRASFHSNKPSLSNQGLRW